MCSQTISLPSPSQDKTIAKQVVYKLLPNFPSDPELDKAMEQHFKEGISYKSIASFIRSTPNADTSSEKINCLDDYLVPRISCFNYQLLTAEQIADIYNIKLDFTKEIKSVQYRYLLMSAIIKMREQNRADHYSFAMIVTFDGLIQWITFFFIIYCLLLLFLRFSWAWMQLKLVIPPSDHTDNKEGEPLIEWEDLPYKNNLLNIKSPQLYKEEVLYKKYPNTFVAQRFSDEVLDSIVNDLPTEKSLFDSVQVKADSMRESVDAGEYHLINFILWVVPSLGFLGTIIGIIQAMESAAGIFESATPLDQIIALNKVAANLGTAFNTTFVSLAGSLFLMFFNAFVQKTEDKIFVKLEYIGRKFLVKDILNGYYNREEQKLKLQ